MMSVNVKQKLGNNVFKIDPESHISINHEICMSRCTAKFCTFVCPARVYTLEADGRIHVEHDGCLECGTCVVACRSDALTWRYPRAGQGVQYRFG
ncbi:MAG: 4Fe-4S dicluster domain-containing protein [Chloroflexi bacterium]|nr:4Fe-4S dicluster domain-containing protein [Chloroflexota bacterium]